MTMREATPERIAVGERLRALRRSRDLTQGELARRCFVTQSSVAYWEAGRRMPRLAVQRNVAELFGIPHRVLFREVLDEEVAA